MNKKQKAREMFISGKYQQQEIAQMVGVTVQTICRWVKNSNWKDLQRINIDELTPILKIITKLEDVEDREYLLNLYKLLGGLNHGK